MLKTTEEHTTTTEPVPIMFTFEREDLKQAGSYGDIHNCLVATTLKRRGYQEVSCGGHFVIINNVHYVSDEIGCGDLSDFFGVPFSQINGYKKSLIGKQLILYPEQWTTLRK